MDSIKNKIENKIHTAIHCHDLPPYVLILITIPRSGSTWLFDSLRSHPAIYILPSGVIYTRLGLRGRRYPLDLSNGPLASVKIEVRPDSKNKNKKWSKVPQFSIKNGNKYVPEEALKNSYAIEKCHPHFFDYDVSKFIGAINTLEKKVNFQIIYQVRDPEASLVSFFRYQRRNPSWYPNRSAEEVLIHLRRSYDAILEMASNRHGLIVDYGDIIKDFRGTILNILAQLWPGEIDTADGDQIDLVKLMKAATDREKRKVGNKFLGKQGLVSGSSGEFDQFFLDNQQAIGRCYQSYRSLIRLQKKLYT
jgi:hypothetical protein